MLKAEERSIKVIQVEDQFVFEIHEVPTSDGIMVEVWIYHTDYDTKKHVFGIMKDSIENPLKLFKYIEDNMDSFIEEYKEEVFE